MNPAASFVSVAFMATTVGIIASGVVASPVSAQEGTQEEPAGSESRSDEIDPVERAQQAREHFQKGHAAFQKRDYRVAIQEFELAAQQVPSADLWYNIARAHEELSEHEKAVENYRRYLRDRVDPPDREQVEARIRALEELAEQERRQGRARPTTGTLRVKSDIEGASLSVDEARVGRTPIEAPLTVGVGGHAINAEQGGRIPFRARPTVEAGMTSGVHIRMDEQTKTAGQAAGRPFTWVTGGVAVAALGLSIGLAVHATSLNSNGDFAGARRWASYSDYALGGALVLGLGAVMLYFLEGRRDPTAEGGGGGSGAAPEAAKLRPDPRRMALTF